MNTLKIGLSLVAIGAVAACSPFSASSRLDQAQSASAGGDAFTQGLYSGYTALAEKEYELTDWKHSLYFSEKALAAAAGQRVAPADLADFPYIPADQVAELTEARGALDLALVESEDPVALAATQVAYDCWVEEADEPWQVDYRPYFRNSCRDAAIVEYTVATISLDDVLFDFDRAEIKPAFSGLLAEVAQVLIADNTAVIIEGNTDSIGSEAYNFALGQRRADAVASYLAGLGVNPALMTTESFGETRPIAPNDTEEGRALNRRVEIRK